MAPKKFKILVKTLSVLSAMVIFVLTVVAIVQFAKIGRAKKTKSELQSKLNYLTQSEANIKSAIERHKDITYAEDYAREKLGYIKDGEIIYEIDN